MGQNRAISVKGSAKLTGTPDWVVIVFNVESESYYYEECTEMLAKRTDILKKELMSLGIEDKNIKTFHFDIDTGFDFAEGRRIFRGYKASHAEG